MLPPRPECARPKNCLAAGSCAAFLMGRFLASTGARRAKPRCHVCSHLIRRVSRFPFYAAARTRHLQVRYRLASEHGLDCNAHVRPTYRSLASRTAAVELAAINKPPPAIKEKEIRCTNGLIRLGDGLGLVEKIRKAKTAILGKLRHGRRRILRVRFDIVRTDGDNCHAFRAILVRELHEAIKDVLHIRAVVADKGDEQQRRCGKFGELPRRTECIGQRELGSFSSKRKHCRICWHVSTSKFSELSPKRICCGSVSRMLAPHSCAST